MTQPLPAEGVPGATPLPPSGYYDQFTSWLLTPAEMTETLPHVGESREELVAAAEIKDEAKRRQQLALAELVRVAGEPYQLSPWRTSGRLTGAGLEPQAHQTFPPDEPDATARAAEAGRLASRIPRHLALVRDGHEQPAPSGAVSALGRSATLSELVASRNLVHPRRGL